MGERDVWRWEQAAGATATAVPAPSFEQLAVRLAAIGELAAAVHAALDLPTIVKAVRRHGRWVLDFSGVALVIGHDEPGMMRVLSGTDPAERQAAAGDGWAAWVLSQAQPVVAPLDLDEDRFRADLAAGIVAGNAASAAFLPLDDGGQTVGVLVFSSPRHDAFGPADLPIAQLIRLQVAAAVRNTLLLHSLETAEAVVMSLAHAVEAKDAYTEGHCRRLADYGFMVGSMLGLSQAELDAVYKGGMLHDIGKIAIPESVLLKPGRLTDDEFRIMQEHVNAGVRICAPLRSLRACLPVIRHHHEHWNGRGYPDRLAGEDIPLPARIISIVDAYDAMTTTRPYRQAMPVERAYAILTENSGPQWDPMLVRCFLDLVRPEAVACA